MSSSRVVSFDFHMVIIESGEGVVERDAGHLPARESRRGRGAVPLRQRDRCALASRSSDPLLSWQWTTVAPSALQPPLSKRT